jgi:signal transduction histidine kinase
VSAVGEPRVENRPVGASTSSKRIAQGIVAAIVVLQIGHLWLWLGRSTGSLSGRSGITNLVYLGVTLTFSLLFAAVGYAIVNRQPGNTIGWLLLALPLVTAIAFFVGDYATEALVIHEGSLPFGRLAAWVDRWLIVVMLTSFIPLFLLFPDGRIPSPRWRPVPWLTIAAPTMTVVSFALTPGRLTGAFADLGTVRVTNPLGIEGLKPLLQVVTQLGGILSATAAILSGIAIVVRYRGASADVRQQIRWLRLVGVAFLIELAANGIAGSFIEGDNLIGDLLFLSMFLTLAVGIPVACGVAILKYRLYDLDLVIRKTVVVGAMALFIALVYAAIVGIGSQLFDSSTLSFAAAVVLALAFQPVRERARKVADRLVYGKRATPYEVLADFSGRMGEAYAADDVLPRMAQVLAAGTGAEIAVVWLRVGPELHPAAVHPADATAPPDPPADAVDVLHQGERLGALSVTMPPSDPMDPSRHKLVEDLAAQAGLVLRNVRLIEELRASRQRLVAAQDEERRKLERNLHDGAQQQLVALAVQLKLARTLVERDPAKSAELLDGLQATAVDALDDLRDLARGIYPPLLADKGLPVALEAQARKSPIPVAVTVEHVARYGQDVEAAVYFSCLEALNNVAKYAEATNASIAITQSDGHLTFAVTDDGRGFDPDVTGYGTGLQGIADRMDAIGGSLSVTSRPGAGATITGTVPVDPR